MKMIIFVSHLVCSSLINRELKVQVAFEFIAYKLKIVRKRFGILE